jgi:hypothetical protein
MSNDQTIDTMPAVDDLSKYLRYFRHHIGLLENNPRTLGMSRLYIKLYHFASTPNADGVFPLSAEEVFTLSGQAERCILSLE